ncbi:MAG: hypothetical protein ACOCX7_03785 [Bacteroidota bacterium]
MKCLQPFFNTIYVDSILDAIIFLNNHLLNATRNIEATKSDIGEKCIPSSMSNNTHEDNTKSIAASKIKVAMKSIQNGRLSVFCKFSIFAFLNKSTVSPINIIKMDLDTTMEVRCLILPKNSSPD